MKYFSFIILFTIALSIKGYSQVKFPIEYRVEKQSMSTPMTILEDALFVRSYFTRPVNVKFDGNILDMHYDNGQTFTRKSVTKVNQEAEYEDGALSLEAYYYTDNNNVSDTIMFVVDYSVGYVQVVLPTKNSKGEKIGYTSYRKFVDDVELALK